MNTPKKKCVQLANEMQTLLLMLVFCWSIYYSTSRMLYSYVAM